MLITYHNEKDLIRECLDSILSQEEGPDEILVYDDASEVSVRGYLPSDSRLQVLRGTTNRGPAHGRNQLLHASHSDYVHFHDADDLFHPDWSRSIRRVIQQMQPDVIFTEISSYKEGKLVDLKVLGLAGLVSGEDVVRFCLRGAMLTSAGTYLKSIVLAIGGYRETLWQAEDFDFHVRLASHGIRYAVIPDPLALKRILPSSRSANRLEVWTSALQSFEYLVKELPLKYQADLADCGVRIGHELFQLGAYSQARRVFRFSFQRGSPSFSGNHQAYRWIAKHFGPEVAEWLGLFYRKVVPEPFRRFARGNF